MSHNEGSQHGSTTHRSALRSRWCTPVQCRVVVLILLAAMTAACGASRSFGRGDAAARAGNWDEAVEHYRRAVQQDPNRTDYKIALERASINASHVHLDQARILEARGMFEDALREYRRAGEYDPTNRQIAFKVQEIEKRLRDLIEKQQPKPDIVQMREQARRASPEPLLNPASREPLNLRFNNTSIRDILNFIGNSAGINVTFDRDFQDRSYTVQLDGVSLEEALNQILSANQLFYKVINERTIHVIPDTPPKRAQYEEQVIRTFFISHADATELAQLINTIIRVPSMAVQPMVAANKTANTITIRATAAVASIIERMIEANDNPRAEVVIDVQILEVNRNRAKQYGLDLSAYSINAVFSPEQDPRVGATTPPPTTPGQPPTTPTTPTLTAPPFNANSISRGISLSDFYLSVPTAVIRFLETDSETKLIAKPQLRGAEGEKLTLNLGDEIPVPATVFTPFAQGGANVNPLTSFNYKPVGVNVEMTPRVTFEGEIILELSVESSTLGGDVNIAGQNLPSFGSRKVRTKLRLRDGESNLLAGLLREDERRSLRGFPGLLRLPVIKQLFSGNDSSIAQTDIVMLLTPRLVRTHELTQQDISPIYIGTQQNLGLGGPPPLIAVPPPVEEPAPGAPQAGAPTPAPGQPVLPAGSGAVAVVPPGSTTVPGTTAAPTQPPVAPTQPAPTAPAGTTPATPGTPPGAPAGVPPTSAPAPAQTTPPAGVPGAPTATPPAQILLTPPGTEFRVGGGPYTVPVSITNASRVSSVTVTITFNPAALRVRSVQEGSFMRSGGASATFTQQVDATSGRIDIAVTRTNDTTGASGAGLVAAILFDAVAAGAGNLSATGMATGPGGAPIPVTVSPVTVTVR
jgi:general secretion pathway protein D